MQNTKKLKTLDTLARNLLNHKFFTNLKGLEKGDRQIMLIDTS